MTALHWAAYNGDTAVVQLLLEKGAKPQINALDNTPVDLAGFSRSVEVVTVFCDWLQEKSSLGTVKSHKKTLDSQPSMPSQSIAGSRLDSSPDSVNGVNSSINQLKPVDPIL